MKHLAQNRRCDGCSWLRHPVQVLLRRPLFSPLPHGEDPCCLVGAMEELVQSALQAALIVPAFTQSEDAGGGISSQLSPQGPAAGAAQQHVEATGAGWLSAALRHAVSVTCQLRQQQHQHQHQDLLLGERDVFILIHDDDRNRIIYLHVFEMSVLFNMYVLHMYYTLLSSSYWSIDTKAWIKDGWTNSKNKNWIYKRWCSFILINIIKSWSWVMDTQSLSRTSC